MTRGEREELICRATVRCEDNGTVFTKTERLDWIRDQLGASVYSCYAELPLARIYAHRDFQAELPFVLVSCHVDSIYETYGCRCGQGSLWGTFDNSACNAIAVSCMLEDTLGAQVLVCFTGNEEYRSRGADQVMAFLHKKELLDRLEMVLVLDLSEENFGQSFSVENLFVRRHAAPGARLRLARKHELANYVEGVLGKSRTIEEGDPDESWQYDEHDLNCLAFCLPCRVVGDDMHDNEGVEISVESVHEYAAALSTLSGAFAGGVAAGAESDGE